MTTLSKIVAQTLDIPLSQVRNDYPDTAVCPDSGPTVASRTVMVVGKLLQDAALKMKKRWAEPECETEAQYVYPEDVYMKKYLSKILFWGTVWGICEATIGFVLHAAAVALPGLPGALMFPIAFFCMYQMQIATGKTTAPFYIATVAAAIKLVDFTIPGYDTIRVVNPALSILLEGLAVTAVYALFIAPGKRPGYSQVLGMGILWRVLFSGYLFLISLIDLPAALVTSGMVILLRFVLLESFYNSLVIYAGLRLVPKLPARKPLDIGPASACTACLLAVVLQALL